MILAYFKIVFIKAQFFVLFAYYCNVTSDNHTSEYLKKEKNVLLSWRKMFFALLLY